MRRMVILLAMLLLTTAFAQASEIGFKGALNIANLTGDIGNNKAMVTFGGGVFARLSAGPQVDIQPEFLLMMKGTQDDGDDVDGKIKLTYFEIPVLVRWQFPSAGTVSPSLFVGPALSLLAGAKETRGDEEVDLKAVIKGADLGLIIGGGIDINSGARGKFVVDVRYTLGVNDVNDIEIPEDIEWKNSVISFSVGYALPLGP